MKYKLAIFGYGGHAIEVAKQIREPVEFFVDDKYSNQNCKPISSFNPNEYKMIVAVADCGLRSRIITRLPKETKFFTFIHPTSLLLSDDIEIGDGSFIGAGSILTTNIKIGEHSILNRCVQIGHDVVIGNFFSAMPNTVISGNVSIGNNVYFGTNSCTKERIKICDNVTIGLNSGVLNDIDYPGTYVGTPVNKIK